MTQRPLLALLAATVASLLGFQGAPCRAQVPEPGVVAVTRGIFVAQPCTLTLRAKSAPEKSITITREDGTSLGTLDKLGDSVVLAAAGKPAGGLYRFAFTGHSALVGFGFDLEFGFNQGPTYACSILGTPDGKFRVNKEAWTGPFGSHTTTVNFDPKSPLLTIGYRKGQDSSAKQ